MNWDRRGRYYWQSDSGYRITKARIRDVFKFTTFYPVANSRRMRLGETFTALAAAAQWCDNNERVSHAA